MDEPSFWVYEGSRRRPGTLATNPALLPENASSHYRPPAEPARLTDKQGLERAAQHLATAPASDFPAVFHQLVNSDFGAVSRLHELVSLAANWCQEHGVRQYGAELETLAERIADIGEELDLVNGSLGQELAGQSDRLAAAVSRSPARSTATAAGSRTHGEAQVHPAAAPLGTAAPAATGAPARRSNR